MVLRSAGSLCTHAHKEPLTHSLTQRREDTFMHTGHIDEEGEDQASKSIITSNQLSIWHILLAVSLPLWVLHWHKDHGILGIICSRGPFLTTNVRHKRKRFYSRSNNAKTPYIKRWFLASIEYKENTKKINYALKQECSLELTYRQCHTMLSGPDRSSNRQNPKIWTRSEPEKKTDQKTGRPKTT